MLRGFLTWMPWTANLFDYCSRSLVTLSDRASYVRSVARCTISAGSNYLRGNVDSVILR